MISLRISCYCSVSSFSLFFFCVAVETKQSKTRMRRKAANIKLTLRKPCFCYLLYLNFASFFFFRNRKCSNQKRRKHGNRWNKWLISDSCDKLHIKGKPKKKERRSVKFHWNALLSPSKALLCKPIMWLTKDVRFLDPNQSLQISTAYISV